MECLFQRLVDLDIALPHFGHKLRQLNASLPGSTGEIFPQAFLDGDRMRTFFLGRNVMKSTDSLRKSASEGF
jgi:hypothetical protein